MKKVSNTSNKIKKKYYVSLQSKIINYYNNYNNNKYQNKIIKCASNKENLLRDMNIHDQTYVEKPVC